jgi:hypothetical protein
LSIQDLLDDVGTPLEVCVEIDSARRLGMLDFDGVDDSVSFGDVLDQGASDSFSVEMLVSVPPPAESGVFASKIPVVNNNTQVGWAIWRWSGSAGGIFITLGDGASGDFIELGFDASAYYDSRERRLSLVVDRAAQRAYIYFDGNLLNLGGTDISAIGSFANSTALLLGRDGTGNFLDAAMRDFRFWTVARTQAQIVASLRAGSVSSTAAGLALYAPMTEGFGQKTSDRTGNSRHGTITGASWIEVTKTWYFSTRQRITGSAETPPSEEFLPYLANGGAIGPLVQSLTEDALFSAQAQISPGVLQVVQPTPTPAIDRLSELHQYTFAGRETRIKIGTAGAAYGTFETYRTFRVDKDPDVVLGDNGLTAQWQLASSLARLLSEPLDVPRYVGIPHALKLLTSTGKVTVPRVAAHDSRYFVVSTRVRGTTVAATRLLFSKFISVANNHFYAEIAATTGKLALIASSAGAADISLTSAASLIDSQWHVVAFARDNNNVAYVLIDQEVVGMFTPAGAADLTAADIIFGQPFGGDDTEICDARFYDRYIPPEELIGILATRAQPGDLGLVGYWPMTDNGGGSANDEGTGNSDGVIAGVLNTDYSWGPSDLGEAELAGRPYPFAIGDLFNAQAHLIDTVRERYRLSSENPNEVAGTTVTVRSRGTQLTGGGTDYTLSDNNRLAQMTSAESEPITFDYRQDTLPSACYPTSLARYALVNRTRIQSAQISSRWDSMLAIAAWRAGFYTDSETSAATMLRELLGGAGLYYTESELGLLYMDMLLPPVGYGPFGEPCFDFNGGRASDVYFDEIGTVAGAGSLTVCGWINTPAVDGTTVGGSQMMYLAGQQLGASGEYSLRFQNESGQFTRLKFGISGNGTLNSPVNPLAPYTWHFVAGVFDDTGNTMKLFLAPLGGRLVEIASQAASTARGTVASDLTIGSRLGDDAIGWGALQHIQVYNVAKTTAQLEAIMANPNASTSGLTFYIPLNEGSGMPVEEVNDITGIAQSLDHFTHRWAPKLLVDLDENPSVKLAEFRPASPASRIDVYHSRNWTPMSPGDIDSGLSQASRWALMREWQSAPIWDRNRSDRFLNARRAESASPLSQQAGAYRMARTLAAKMSDGRFIGMMEFPEGSSLSRRALGLNLGDEVGIKVAIPRGLSVARSFRVTSVAPSPLTLATQISFWG